MHSDQKQGKTLTQLDLESKGQGHSKKQKPGSNKHARHEKMSRDLPNYWCLTCDNNSGLTILLQDVMTNYWNF